MEDFIVSARKYRPVRFDSVVGQSSITQTLKNSIKTQRVGQTYLFCGPRGVGKTTCARIFAKTLNCENRTDDVEACGECESCRMFQEGTAFNVFELDAASNNSVNDIRSLIDQVRIPPQHGKYSVYIIDEVHMLSPSAFNAFLKTLEEPPRYAIFILATTEKHKVLGTILSRCQIFDFNRIKATDIAQHIQQVAQKEGVTIDADALNIIATKADGGLRDALSIFDQIVSFCGKNVTYKNIIDNLNVLDYDYYFKLTNMFLQGDYTSALLTLDEILNKGFDERILLDGLSSHFRDLITSRDQRTLKLLDVSENLKNRYIEQAQTCSMEFLFTAMDIAHQFDEKYRDSQNKRLHIELAMLKLSNIVKKKNNVVSFSSTTATQKPQQTAQVTSTRQGYTQSQKPQQNPSVQPQTQAAPKPTVQQQAPQAQAPVTPKPTVQQQAPQAQTQVTPKPTVQQAPQAQAPVTPKPTVQQQAPQAQIPITPKPRVQPTPQVQSAPQAGIISNEDKYNALLKENPTIGLLKKKFHVNPE